MTVLRNLGLSALLLLLLLLAAISPGRVQAHAVLLRSIPPAGQTLSRAPEEVQLLFSEPIDAAFASVRVLDSSRRRVDANDGHVDQANDHLLVISLPPGLANGTYTVSWRSLSTIDVHPDEGEYALYVGVPVPAGASATLSGQTSATPETTLGRWWFYMAASLFGGVLATWKFVLSGVLVGTSADARAAVRRRTYRLIVLGGVLLVLGTLYTAVAQAAAAAGVPLGEAVGRPLADLLLRGRFASLWWPRLGLEVAGLLLVGLGGLEGMAAESALATLPAVLLTSSLTSHGAALPGGVPIGIAVDWLHIVGASAWVGGLISLVVLLPVVRGAHQSSLDRVVLRLIGRFSRFALATSAVVVLSGVVQAVIQVGSWSGLLETTYGQLVLAKVGLLGAMLSLAAFNDRRGRAHRAGGVLMWRGGVRAELVVGLLALATAAILVGTVPTRGAL
ncbi:MAG: copper resistance protein CopC/CopD [Chloroflexi bacterium]|nr:copper resistance protein CopC/CopD [Chloroflexota bacterium]